MLEKGSFWEIACSINHMSTFQGQQAWKLVRKKGERIPHKKSLQTVDIQLGSLQDIIWSRDDVWWWYEHVSVSVGAKSQVRLRL